MLLEKVNKKTLDVASNALIGMDPAFWSYIMPLL